MRTLELFETRLTVLDSGEIRFHPSPPLFEVIESDSRLVGSTARLRCFLKAGAHIIFMSLDVQVRDVGGMLRPVRGRHPQPPGSRLFIERLMAQPVRPSLNAELALLSGAFRLINVRFPADGVISDGQRLTFHFEQREVTRLDHAPLWIDLLPTSLENQGFYLDLGVAASADGNRPRVVFLPNTFQATAATRLEVTGSPVDRLSNDLLLSQESIFSLEHLIESPEIRFEPARAGTTVQLYADLLDARIPYSAASNPVVAPMEAEQFNLVARLARLNSSQSKITRVSLFPPPGIGRSFRLTCYTFSDTHNKPIVWRIASELKLHLRTGTARRPATFLIAPEYPEGRDALSVERLNAGMIHGFNEGSRFEATRSAQLVCDTLHPAGANPAEGIDGSIVSEMTAPWFNFPGVVDAANRFDHVKPGQNYVAPSAVGVAAVDTYVFKGTRLALPALPSVSFRDGEPRRLEERTLETINQIISGNVRDDVRSIRHETFIREAPSDPSAPDDIRVTRAFRPKPVALPAPGQETVQDVRLATYRVIRQVGPVRIKLAVDPDKHRDFVVLRAGQEFEFVNSDFAFRLDRHRLDFTLGGAPEPGGTPLPFGVLKLSKRFTLPEIFRMSDITVDDEFWQRVVHPTIQQREWVGLILFKLPVAASAQQNAQVLRSLIPDGLKLEYVALTSDKPPDAGAGDARFSVTARLRWTAPAAPAPAPSPDPASNETVFSLKSLDVEWYDSALNFFHAEALLQFESFLGVTKNSSLRIIGSYDKARDTIRFLGQLQEPLSLLPPDMFGPIRQVEVKGAEILLVRGQTAISLDGRITFGDFPPFRMDDGSFADFDGLQIRLPEVNPGGIPLRLSIDYPNLRFNFAPPPFRLGFLSLKLGGLRVHFNPDTFDASGMLPVPQIATDPGTLGRVALFFELRLELMKLPELAAKALDRLILDFVIGLGANGANFDSTRIRAWLRAVSFENLKLDLMRFLTAKAERIELVSKRPPEVPGQPNPPEGVMWIKLVGVEVSVLNTTIIKNLSVFIFSAGGNRRGFIAYFEGGPDSQSALLDIKWALIGHNVALTPGLATHIMQVDATAEGPQGETPIHRQLKQAVDNFDILPAPGDTRQGAWVFAAGFKFMGELLDGKFLFQDKAYYGICLGGGIFKEWFGYEFAISVLYVKAAQPNQDSFIVSVRVPQVTLPAFNFMGGVITIEVVMDGGFLLDVGFPRLSPGGGRQWDRAFGAIISPFQGSGGFYIQKRHVESVVETAVGGDMFRGLLVGGGYAVQGGLGASFGGPVFRVWATVGVYFILEGAIFIGRSSADNTLRLRGLRLVGASGILVRAAGELNWWIISVRVELTLSAEARATLTWGSFFNASADNSSATLTLDFELHASARAEACIGRWKFKICKGISVSIPLRFSHTLTLRA